MMVNDIKIPTPFQFTMDDIGWMEGRSPYWDNYDLTRTGLPRRHTIKDYEAINQIGKSVDMKICGMFVLGDWDKDGILAKVPGATKLGKNWTGSPYVDVDEQTEIRDFLNSCTHLEMAVHGLFHKSYGENGEGMGGEFIPSKDLKPGNPGAPAPEWYMRAHFEGFMEIMESWGFSQKPRSFTCPGHCLDAWENGTFTKVLKDFDIKFWQEPYISHPFYDNGVLLNKMPGWIGFWEAYDINPDKLPTYTEETAGIICSHWPNFLRLDPDLNLERLDKWTSFFNRQAEVFGIILSRDIAFAHYQLYYKHHTKITEENGLIKIDCTDADKNAQEDFDAPLYISIKNGAPIFECEGGDMVEYETRKDFKNYQIKRNGNSVIYLKPVCK